MITSYKLEAGVLREYVFLHQLGIFHLPAIHRAEMIENSLSLSLSACVCVCVCLSTLRSWYDEWAPVHMVRHVLSPHTHSFNLKLDTVYDHYELL